jgi:hypothetical protein
MTWKCSYELKELDVGVKVQKRAGIRSKREDPLQIYEGASFNARTT